MPMICPGFLSSADRIELEACVRRQREDHGIALPGKLALFQPLAMFDAPMFVKAPLWRSLAYRARDRTREQYSASSTA
jgi:hypothetical protein